MHPPERPPDTLQGPNPFLAKLQQCPAFERYGRAFRKATGLSLWLAGPDNAQSCLSSNPFCLMVNGRGHSCEECEKAHTSLRAGDGDEALTVKCFANLRETAVPVWLGKTLVAHLRTGQVFATVPTEENFSLAVEILREDPQFRETDLEALRQSYFAGKVVPEEHYAAIVELLVLFAMQLSCELERQPIVQSPAIPEPIKRVCLHLRRTFDQPFSLLEASRLAGMSSHHLCTVFKTATGTTLTEFHNRERILQAKRRLTSRYVRVSEVALDVGFGSLSQFNRSFLKYAGESPTEFRKRVLSHHLLHKKSRIR